MASQVMQCPTLAFDQDNGQIYSLGQFTDQTELPEQKIKGRLGYVIGDTDSDMSFVSSNNWLRTLNNPYLWEKIEEYP